MVELLPFGQIHDGKDYRRLGRWVCNADGLIWREALATGRRVAPDGGRALCSRRPRMDGRRKFARAISTFACERKKPEVP